MNARYRSATLFVFVGAAWAGVFAADCPGGAPSAAECIRELKGLETQLARVYAIEEKRLIGLYKEPGYGGLPGAEYSAEALRGFREANAAWRIFRDKECWYLALRDGMNLSPDYASPVSEACKVHRTADRIKALSK